MMEVQDQLGKKLFLKGIPEKIVSLVPSITELLVDLGLEARLVGVTKYCVHPKRLKDNVKLIGGTKNINVELINELNPDVIIASKEENVKEQIEALINPVWVSDICNLDDAKEMIRQVGQLTGSVTKSNEVLDAINLEDIIPANKKVAYLIWRKPYMTIGNYTFIHDMLQRAGYHNVFADKVRYPIVTLEDLKQEGLDYVFLSTEPFPYKEKHFTEFERIAKPVLVDGEMFSWYGSRLVQSRAYFEELRTSLGLE